MGAVITGAGPVSSSQASTLERDEAKAVAALHEQLEPQGGGCALIFASSRYDLRRLGHELDAQFKVPVYGCTGAGLFGPGGMQRGGLVGVNLAGPGLRVEGHLVAPLDRCQEMVRDVAETFHRRLESLPAELNAAVVLLVDGLSRAEERLSSALYQSLGDVPIIGGSAGDDLRFERTHILYEGRFVSDAALLMLVTSPAPLVPIRAQHYRATNRKVVVTESRPDARILSELQGEPAAQAYAELIGVPVEELTPNVFSKNPLMLQIGGEYYVRSVQKVNADGSLSLYCSVEDGLVLAIGQAGDPLEELEQVLSAAAAKGGKPGPMLGFDCVLRRLAYEQDRVDRGVSELLRRHQVVGFNSYGEQCNSLHMNQTFIGLQIGG